MLEPRRSAQVYNHISIPTVHPLELIDDLAKSHLVVLDLASESWQDTSTKLEGSAQVLLGPAVIVELQLRWDLVREVGVGDVQRVEVGNVVASDLVSANEELDLANSQSCRRCS
jgi:hypothetical protein